MSGTKLAFLLRNSARATIHIFSLDSMLNISCIWCLPFQHPSPCSHVSERRPQSHQMPDSVIGLLTPGYDCLWNDARGRNQDPITFVSSSPTPDCSWLWAPALGTQFLRQEHTVFPSPLPKNKSHDSVSSKRKIKTLLLEYSWFTMLY